MVENPRVVLTDDRYESSTSIRIEVGSVLVHGQTVDERSESSTGIDNAGVSERVVLLYDYEEMTLSINEQLVDADNATEIFKGYFLNRHVVIDATTLGVSELFYAIRSLVDLGIYRFKIIYVEPGEYTRVGPAQDSFALSAQNAGFRPLPRSIVDLSSDEVEAGVFFIGYEANRLENALESHQMLAYKDLKVVVGIPAFQAGWELNSIVPHLELLNDVNVSYCSANDPDSAFESLNETLKSLSPNAKMFVAPIGTKPCSIAATIFAAIHPSRVGLMYDHRTKSKNRSSGVHVWHDYGINIIYS